MPPAALKHLREIANYHTRRTCLVTWGVLKEKKRVTEWILYICCQHHQAAIHFDRKELRRFKSRSKQAMICLAFADAIDQLCRKIFSK